MYQNLVRSFADEPAPISVHLCDYPQVKQDRLDRELNSRMAAVQQVVSLGHKLRDDARVRVRQPLAELRVAWLPTADREEQKRKATAVETLDYIIEEELNIKTIARFESLDQMVRYRVRPNMKILGAKHGKSVGTVRSRIEALDSDQIGLLRLGKTVTFTVDNVAVEVGPGDVFVEAEVETGWVFAEDGGVQVALSTKLTPELEREGMARDFVRHVQQLRKDAELDIVHRIVVEFATTDEPILQALQEWDEYIRVETLADRLMQTHAGDDWKKVQVGPGSLQLSIEPVNSEQLLS
jgi:isoleucyl-tRNA synthetase